MRPRRHERWALGPIGYLSLLVLGGLIACVVAGVDLRLFLLQAITDTFGIDATYWFVSRYITWTWFAIWGPEYSLLTAIILTLGLFIGERRVPWWVYAIICGFGLLWPHFAFEAYAVISRPLGLSYAMSQAVLQPVPFIVLAVLSGRRFVWLSVPMLLLCKVGMSFIREFPVWDPSIPNVTFWVDAWVVLFNAILIGTTIYWTCTAGLGPRGKRPCPGCGYELEGVPDGCVCPECGAARSA